MNNTDVVRMRDFVGPGVLKIFNVKSKLPPVQFVQGLPGLTAFAYTRKKGEHHIAVDPNYDTDYEGILSIQWGMAEELSHFCHYMLNRDFFMKKIDLTEDKSVKDRRELLEMDNLCELIARMAGLASNVCLPSDFGQTIEAWKELTKVPGAKSQKKFKRFVKQHPDYDRNLSYASARVWGTGLADHFAGAEGIRKNLPKYRKIIRSLTQCCTFDEAAMVFEKYIPGSKQAEEVRAIQEKLFSR